MQHDCAGTSVMQQPESRFAALKQSHVDEATGEPRTRTTDESHTLFLSTVQQMSTDEPFQVNALHCCFENLLPEMQQQLSRNGVRPPETLLPDQDQLTHPSALEAAAEQVEEDHPAVVQLTHSQLSQGGWNTPSNRTLLAVLQFSLDDFSRMDSDILQDVDTSKDDIPDVFEDAPLPKTLLHNVKQFAKAFAFVAFVSSAEKALVKASGAKCSTLR